MVIDIELVQRAAILTGIGIGTAFAMLLSLMAVTGITGFATRRWVARSERRAVPVVDAAELIARREKALAAVVAVAALLSARRLDDASNGREGNR